MNKREFDNIFRLICINANRKPETMSEKAELIYHRFENENIRDFTIAAKEHMDDSDRMPTNNQLKVKLALIKSDNPTEKQSCKACNYGFISLIHVMVINPNTKKDETVDKYHDSQENQIELRKQNKRTFVNSYRCRCEAGQYLSHGIPPVEQEYYQDLMGGKE